MNDVILGLRLSKGDKAIFGWVRLQHAADLKAPVTWEDIETPTNDVLVPAPGEGQPITGLSMTIDRSPRTRGFTLIEPLVVIASLASEQPPPFWTDQGS